jgi:mono/diheme cytochrome c family protein
VKLSYLLYRRKLVFQELSFKSNLEEFMHKVLNPVFLTLALLSLSPSVFGQASAAPKGGTVSAGQEVFTQKCFQCHSVIEDQVRFGPSLFHEMKGPHPKKTATEIHEILMNGKGKMPSFKDILTQEDTDNLLAYLHSL